METITIDNIEYRHIEEFNGYYISQFGRIYSTKSGKFIKTRLARNTRYVNVILTNKRNYCKTVHRLVALTWIPNPDNKSDVNHKDGNKLNNHITNLEWITHQENMQHAYNTGLWKPAFCTIRNSLVIGDEQKRKMSEAKKGTKHPKFKGYTITPYGRFESAYSAGRAEGKSHSYILKRIKSENFQEYYIELIIS
jgi:HNH endonuclease/NUMOD3 motif